MFCGVFEYVVTPQNCLICTFTLVSIYDIKDLFVTFFLFFVQNMVLHITFGLIIFK